MKNPTLTQPEAPDVEPVAPGTPGSEGTPVNKTGAPYEGETTSNAIPQAGVPSPATPVAPITPKSPEVPPGTHLT